MTLTEEEKKKVEEEEAYRAEIREKSKKKKRIGCLGWIVIFFVIGIVVSALTYSSNPTKKINNATSNVNSQVSEEQKKKEEEQRKQQSQELSNLFCTERSKPNIRAVNLADFIAMYEAKGETVKLRPANGVYPTNENCQKVIDICLKLWDTEECKKISETKIWIGMTKDQLILSWGLPNDRNNSTYSFGVNSQWVYGTYGPYVYLEGKDDNSMKVTSWQD
ncbi:MAG: hypothetical protein M1450_02315 [Patescibacteria group bacterium]|nr:hypothetical protein [Patescibacteria group bacterium]